VAGIAPTVDQIEMFSHFLPHYSFVRLLDIFCSICRLNKDLFISEKLPVRELAETIEHIENISIRDRYTFCLVPMSAKRQLIVSFFQKIVQRYSEGVMLNFDFVDSIIRPNLKPANRPEDLARLSDAYDIVGGYLWWSYRFPGYFPDVDRVRPLEKEINDIYYKSLRRIVAGGDSHTL